MTFTVAAFAAAAAVAQTSNSPNTGNLTFGTTLDVNSNRDLAAVSTGATFQLSEDIGLSLRTETSTQALEFSASGGLTLDDSGSVTFSSPDALLRYTRDAANGDLSLEARYRSSDVSSSYLDDPLDPFSVIVDSGTLTVTGASFSVNLREDAPLSFGLDASFDNRDYAGTTNPALFDETTLTLGVTANMRLSPTTEAAFAVTGTDYASQDASSTEYQQMDYVLTVTHELANAVTISGDLGYRDRLTTAGGTPTRDAGLIGGLDLTRDLSNGSIFGGVSFDGSGSGAATSSLTFGRTLELPSGSLSASLTTSFSSGSPAQFAGSASYTQELPDGAFSVDFSQSYLEDSLGRDIRYSNLGLGYSKALNSDASLSLSLSASRSEDAGSGAAPTLDRAALAATYSRALTPDWNMSVGYVREQLGGATTAASDSVFLTLTKDLQFAF